MGDATPTVTAIIATRGRPELIRVAIRAILAQDHPDPIDILVVFDQIDPDPFDDIVVPEGRTLRTMRNQRTPGLAGGRNTGIEAVTTDLIAFCDDDDHWRPDKLRKQLDAWARDPEAIGLATGIAIHSEGGEHVRMPPAIATFDDFLVSRITEIHPSGFLFRKADLEGRIGLVDEELPASYGEDYDLLLRATRHGHIRSVLEPLVIVNWNRPSFFNARWQGIAEGLTYIFEKFPELDENGKGTARITSQIAFAHASLGDRAEARRWAKHALRNDKRQLRAYAAYGVSLGLPAGALVRVVNRFGRGL